MNLLSHIALGLALSEVLRLELLWVIIGVVLPDVDYLIGVTHRTIMHSAVFVALISLLMYKSNKRKGVSLFIGLSSHLLLDVFTTQGVMLLWPVKTFYSYGLFNSGETAPNLLVIIISLVILWNKDIISSKLSLLGYKKVQKYTYSIILIPLLLVIPYYYFQLSQCEQTSINDLLSNAEVFSEACVVVNGIVCSEVDEYTSSSATVYNIFDLCDGDESIKVWLLSSLNPDLEFNDNVTITSLFTTKFEEPELYMVKSVRKD
jgi:inner membrane protein